VVQIEYESPDSDWRRAEAARRRRWAAVSVFFDSLWLLACVLFALTDLRLGSWLSVFWGGCAVLTTLALVNEVRTLVEG
jgi:hypothetical protein